MQPNCSCQYIYIYIYIYISLILLLLKYFFNKFNITINTCVLIVIIFILIILLLLLVIKKGLIQILENLLIISKVSGSINEILQIVIQIYKKNIYKNRKKEKSNK